MSGMSRFFGASGFLAVLLSVLSCTAGDKPSVFLSTTDREFLLEQVEPVTEPSGDALELVLDPGQMFQEIDGFGAAVTGSTCYNLLQMEPQDRTALLRRVFDPVEGVGYSCIRISIGCSDFSLMEYTCCDVPGIEHFGIPEVDRMDLFPVLREILSINPSVKIIAAPWTCPRWMKVDNLEDLNPLDSWTSGQLNPACYGDYAEYFVRYVQQMAREGFDIYAVTIQNEPLNRGNSASLYMGWREQLAFVRDFLGPAFERSGIRTKIWVFDHNYNYDNIPQEQDYAMNILGDSLARKYVAGSAWHNYGGRVTELDHVYAAYPDKDIFFTECSIGKWSAPTKEACFEKDLMSNTRSVCIGTLSRGGRGVTVWNLLLDEQGAPNRPGGCRTCYGALEIDSGDYRTLTGNSHFYSIAHFSKVIRPGARRIASGVESPRKGISQVACQNPDGTIGVVLLNENPDREECVVLRNGWRRTAVRLPAGSVVSVLLEE